jgi:AMP deaminase
MEEKRWAHRRTSDVSAVLSDSTPSVGGNFGLSAIRESLQPPMNEEQTNTSPFIEDEDKMHTVEPQLQCAGFLSRFGQRETTEAHFSAGFHYT